MLVTASCKTNREDREEREWMKPMPVVQIAISKTWMHPPFSLLPITFFTRAQRYFVRSTQFWGAMLWPLGSTSGATALSLCVSPSHHCPHIVSSTWNACVSSLLQVMFLALQSLSSSGTHACLLRPTELPVAGFHSTLPNAYLPGNEISLGISRSVSSLKAARYQGGPWEWKHILSWYLCLPSPWDLFKSLFLPASVVCGCHEGLSICLCISSLPFCHEAFTWHLRCGSLVKLPKIPSVT